MIIFPTFFVDFLDDWTYFTFSGRHIERNLIEEIDRRILIITSMGVPFVSDREKYPGSFSCLAKNQEDVTTIHSLTYTDIQFSLDAHFIALIFCILILFVEILHHSVTTKRGHRKV